MMEASRGIDHVVLSVRDLDSAESFFTRAGFTLTPRAEHPFGTSNHLAILDGKFKYLENSKGNHLLFDLDADRGEMKNLVDENPEQAAALKSKLADYLAALPKPGLAGPEQEIDGELTESLESMGYLE